MKAIPILLLLSHLLFAADTLTVTFGNREDTYAFRTAATFIEEVNRRLDSTLVLELIYEPFGRAALHLTEGVTDGDFLRTEYVYPAMDSLIKIPVAITWDRLFLFCRGDLPDSVRDTASLENRYISVLGNRIVQQWKEENNIPVHEVVDYRQAIKMVALGRGECAILSELHKFDTLLTHYNLKMGTTPLFSAGNYLFIHKKHEKHAGQLTSILYQLDKERYLIRLMNGELE